MVIPIALPLDDNRIWARGESNSDPQRVRLVS